MKKPYISDFEWTIVIVTAMAFLWFLDHVKVVVRFFGKSRTR